MMMGADMQIRVPVVIDETGARCPDFDGRWAQPIYHDDGTVTITVLDAPPGWRPPGVLSRLEFLRRLTPEERSAARQSADPRIEDWLHLLSVAEEVRLDDPDVVAAVEYAEQIGLIAEGRAAEILEP